MLSVEKIWLTKFSYSWFLGWTTLYLLKSISYHHNEAPICPLCSYLNYCMIAPTTFKTRLNRKLWIAPCWEKTFKTANPIFFKFSTHCSDNLLLASVFMLIWYITFKFSMRWVENYFVSVLVVNKRTHGI